MNSHCDADSLNPTSNVSDDCSEVEVVDEISDIIDVLLTSLGDSGNLYLVKIFISQKLNLYYL